MENGLKFGRTRKAQNMPNECSSLPTIIFWTRLLSRCRYMFTLCQTILLRPLELVKAFFMTPIFPVLQIFISQVGELGPNDKHGMLTASDQSCGKSEEFRCHY